MQTTERRGLPFRNPLRFELVIFLDRDSLFALTSWVEDDGLLPGVEINRMHSWHLIE